MCVELGSSGFPPNVEYSKVVRIVINDPHQPECLRLLKEKKFTELKVLELSRVNALEYLEAAVLGCCPLLTVQISSLTDALFKILLLLPTLKNLEVKEAGNETLSQKLPHLRRLECVSSEHSILQDSLEGYRHLGFKRTDKSLKELLSLYPHLTSFKIYTGSYGKEFYRGLSERDIEWLYERREVEFATRDRSKSLATMLFKGWLRGLVPEKVIESLVEKGEGFGEALATSKFDKIQRLYQTSFWKKLVMANLEYYLEDRIGLDTQGNVMAFLYEWCRNNLLDYFLILAARHDEVKYFEDLRVSDPVLDKLKGRLLTHIGSSQVKLMHILFEKGYKPSPEEINQDIRNHSLRIILALRGYRIQDMRESVIRIEVMNLCEIIQLERGGPLDEEGNNCFHFIGGNYIKLSKLLEVLTDFSLLFAKNAKGETPFSMKDNHQILMVEALISKGFSLTFEKGEEKYSVGRK